MGDTKYGDMGNLRDHDTTGSTEQIKLIWPASFFVTHILYASDLHIPISTTSKLIPSRM